MPTSRMHGVPSSASAVHRRSAISFLIASLRPAELHSESLALVDMLVLIQARKFVGFDMSTLSWCAASTRSKAIGTHRILT